MSLTHSSKISSALHASLQPVVSLPQQHKAAIQHIINDAVAIQSGAARPPLPKSCYDLQPQEPMCLKPRMDLLESTSTTDARPLMTAIFELPGLRKEDVHIEVLDNRMIVEGHREDILNVSSATGSAVVPEVRVTQDEGMDLEGMEGATKMDATAAEGSDKGERRVAPMSSGNLSPAKERYIIRDIKRGRFKRVVPLPSGTKLEDMKASMQDGILTVTFPGFLQPVPQNLPIS